MIVLLVFALVLFIVYLVMTNHYQKYWMKDIEVEVSFSEEQAGVGDSLYLYETVTNKKKMKLPAICVKFGASKYLAFEDETSGTVSDHFYRNDVMSVDGFQKVRRKLRFTCKKRGLYRIEDAELVSYDMLFSRPFVYRMSLEAELCVYPSLISVERLIPVFRYTNGSLKTKIPLFEDPYAFAGVREYTPQDSMRKIHWKASARMGTWQVKTTEYNASTPVVIMLNLETPGVFTPVDLLEESICLAYSLVYYLSRQGVTIRLVAAGNEKIRLEGTGRHQLAATRYALATIAYDDVCCRGEEFVEEELSRLHLSDHVILISVAGKKPMQDAVEEMMRRVDQVTWVAPLISENSEDYEFRETSPAIERCLVKWGGR